MPLKENFTYNITNTYVTDSGEGRVLVNLTYHMSEEVEGNFVNTSVDIANFNFGIGLNSPDGVDVEGLLKIAVPQYFYEIPVSNT